jgi:hypothetical protein
MNSLTDINSVILDGIQYRIRREIREQFLKDRSITHDSQRIIPVTFVFDWMKGDLVSSDNEKKVIPQALHLTLLVDWDKNLIFFEAESWLQLEELLEKAPLTLHQRSALMGIYSLNGKEIEEEKELAEAPELAKASRVGIGLRRLLGLVTLLSLGIAGCNGLSSQPLATDKDHETQGVIQGPAREEPGVLAETPEKEGCRKPSSAPDSGVSEGEDCRKEHPVRPGSTVSEDSPEPDPSPEPTPPSTGEQPRSRKGLSSPRPPDRSRHSGEAVRESQMRIFPRQGAIPFYTAKPKMRRPSTPFIFS